VASACGELKRRARPRRQRQIRKEIIADGEHPLTRSAFVGSNLRRGSPSLMYACQKSGVARVVANRIEQRIDADKGHIEAVLVDRVVEGFEGMVEFVHANIIDAYLVTSARLGCGA
jgi:hypothetical protein